MERLGIKVGDIMTREFISVKPDTSIQDCAKLMAKKRVGSLVIQENKKLRGLITEKDIIWAITKKSLSDLSKIKVEAIARKKVAVIKPSADIHDAMQLMRKSNYRRLPVVVEGNVIGFITLKDILNIEPGLFEIAKNFNSFQIREENEKLKRRAMRIECKNARDGICEECGNFDMLCDAGGRLICESCRDEI